MVLPVPRDQDLLGGLIAFDFSWVSLDQLLIAVRHAGSNVTSQGILAELRDQSLIDDQDRHVLHYLARRELQTHDLATWVESRELPDSVLTLVGELSDLDVANTTDVASLVDTGLHTPHSSANVEATLDIETGNGEGPTAVTPRSSPSHRFTRLRPHARGGLGQVSIAWDEELGREVAFKQMHTRFVDDRESRRRFQFEAELTGRLEHPGVVPVYGAGEDRDAGPYYAMRFIKGNSLAAAIQRYHANRGVAADETREFRQLLGHLIGACNAIGFAHSRGVIHRDIKPANMMIGDFGETFVVDWGLAKYQGTADNTTGGDLELISGAYHMHTQPGSIAGTLAFMSPEQARGDLEALGPTSDVYSLGASLYFMLTGRAAFTKADADRSRTELLRRVQEGDFLSPRSIRSDISPALNAICMKAMATDATQRYPSTEAFKQDLENWLAGEPVTAWSEPWSVRTRRWISRHRTYVVAASVAVGIATVGLAAIVAIQSKANRDLIESNHRLTVARDLASSRADLALAAIGKIPDAVEHNVDVQNHPELATLRDQLLQAPKEFYEAFQQQVVDSGDTAPATLLRLAGVYRNLGDLSSVISSQQGAIESYQAGIEIMDSLLSTDPERPEYLAVAGKLHHELADLLIEHPDLGDAQPELDQAEAIQSQLLSEAPEQLNIQSQLGLLALSESRVHRRASRFDQAIEAVERAQDHLQHVVNQIPDDAKATFNLARTQSFKAELLDNIGQLAEAREILSIAIQSLEELVDSPAATNKHKGFLGRLFAHRGVLERNLGNLEASRANIEAGLEIIRQLSMESPGNHQLRSTLCHNLGELSALEYNMGNIQRAFELTQESNRLRAELVAQNPTNISYRQAEVSGMMGFASRLYMAGRKSDAIEVFWQVIPKYEALCASQPDDYRMQRGLAGTHYNLGMLLSEQGRLDESLEAYQSALAMRRQLAAAHPEIAILRNDVAFTLGNIANVLESQGQFEAALAHSEQVIELQRQVVQDSPERPEFLGSLGRSLTGQAVLLGQLGRGGEALAHFDEAMAILTQGVEASPQLTQSRRDLVACYRHVANLHANLGDESAARTAYADASRAVESLVTDRPEEIANQFLHGLFHSNFADALVRFGDLHAAREEADEARTIADGLLAQNPDDAQFTEIKALSCRSLAEAHAGLGNQEEAEQASKAWLEAQPDAPQTEQLCRLWLKLWSGHVAEAVTLTESLLSQDIAGPTKLACARVLAAAAQRADVNADVQEASARRAVELLVEMNANQQLSAADRLELRFGPAFASLRERDGFPHVE